MPSRRLRILIAPSGFKESLGPEEVAQCIEDGVRRVLPESAAYIHKVPLHDGGEGFCRALVSVYRGDLRRMTVTGPVGKLVSSHLGLIGQDTAVLDMAAAAGLRLVPNDLRDPTVTTTFGVGELIAAALDEGRSKIIVGCGDSGTSDGGAGMLQALGFRLLDAQGRELPRAAGGSSLVKLHSIDTSNIHPRLRDGTVKIEAVCNIKNVLCGPQGVARVYGPQKGATPDQVEILSSALDRFAEAVDRHIVSSGGETKQQHQQHIGSRPGSGASGGLGAGLMLLGGRLRPRGEAADEYFGLGKLFGNENNNNTEQQQKWDLMVTGEGSLDHQSAKGKMTVEMAKRARKSGCPVVVLAGTIGEGAEALYDSGIAAYTSILDGPQSLEKAIGDADRLVRDAAEKSIRMIHMGMVLGMMNATAPSPAPATTTTTTTATRAAIAPSSPRIKPVGKKGMSLERVPSIMRVAGMTN